MYNPYMPHRPEIPPALWRRVKVAAAHDGVSGAEWVREAVRERLGRETALARAVDTARISAAHLRRVEELTR